MGEVLGSKMPIPKPNLGSPAQPMWRSWDGASAHPAILLGPNQRAVGCQPKVAQNLADFRPRHDTLPSIMIGAGSVI